MWRHAHWLLNYALELEHAPAEHTSGALQVCGFWFHFHFGLRYSSRGTISVGRMGANGPLGPTCRHVVAQAPPLAGWHSRVSLCCGVWVLVAYNCKKKKKEKSNVCGEGDLGVGRGPVARRPPDSGSKINLSAAPSRLLLSEQSTQTKFLLFCSPSPKLPQETHCNYSTL